eukprot:Pgem_evm1s13460
MLITDPRGHSPRDHSPRDHSPRDHSRRDHSPRDHSPRDHSPRGHTPVFLPSISRRSAHSSSRLAAANYKCLASNQKKKKPT